MARPVTVGIGKRLSIYIPRELYRRMLNCEMAIGCDNDSRFIQSAISCFCGEVESYERDMTMMITEVEKCDQ